MATTANLSNMTLETLKIRFASLHREYDKIELEGGRILNELQETTKAISQTLNEMTKVEQVKELWDNEKLNIALIDLAVLDHEGDFPLPSHLPSKDMKWIQRCGSRGEYFWEEVENK